MAPIRALLSTKIGNMRDDGTDLLDPACLTVDRGGSFKFVLAPVMKINCLVNGVYDMAVFIIEMDRQIDFLRAIRAALNFGMPAIIRVIWA